MIPLSSLTGADFPRKRFFFSENRCRLAVSIIWINRIIAKNESLNFASLSIVKIGNLAPIFNRISAAREFWEKRKPEIAYPNGTE